MGPSSLFWLLLLSPIFHLTVSTELRKFVSRPNYVKKNWDETLKECEKEYNSHLVTLHNRYDLKMIQDMVVSNTFLLGVHLGLHEKSNSSEWSNGEKMTNWTTDGNVAHEQRCVAIHNKRWSNHPCNETMYFMCYNATEYQLIEQEKDWCEARLFCRKHFTDLVSINTNTQNEKALRRGANRAFWIGLKHDNYEWEDGQCSTFREGIPPKMKSKECASLGLQFGFLLGSCGNRKNIICMQGDTRITVPTDPLTWEEAYDYCKENHDGLLFIRDQDEQSEVKKWLNVTGVPGPVWLGLRQSRAFGFWFWSTIDQVVNVTNWKNNTAPELPLSYHCGAIEAGGRWRDVNCQTKLPALCIEDMDKKMTLSSCDDVKLKKKKDTSCP
ncbi:macrophage mannose receptor 1-like isoform X2 [Gadus macrocephalus]|uniref:macrophage mannose receptor 1-like isoform X2 n=1 Tax=Gadus macrocephalus TaxID=80720 RepID=UPI0028CBAC9F|nr:macrophage mannose receptor 1-like isoform X2 [Gadus macrocephalus]